MTNTNFVFTVPVEFACSESGRPAPECSCVACGEVVDAEFVEMTANRKAVLEDGPMCQRCLWFVESECSECEGDGTVPSDPWGVPCHCKLTGASS